MRIFIGLLALVLAGCTTERQVLELRRDRLLAVEANAQTVRAAIPDGTYDPARYDMYLAIDADVFQRMFGEIDGTKIEVVSKGRPITIAIDKFATRFRPGSPEVTLAARALDQNTGLDIGLKIDTRLVLEGDPANPGEMTAKIYATRLVPEVRWGPLNFTRARIVRSLLSLEASKLTDKLPAMKLPLAKDFSFGSSARAINSGRIALAGDAWMSGDVTVPDTRTAGHFVVNKILFLENGIHIFGSVEGI